MLEIPIHEHTYMNTDAERLWTSFRTIVREPGASMSDWIYIMGGYWADEDQREETLDMFVKIFTIYFDAGFTEIVDYFLPKDT